jgi:hypothetical protein
MLSFSKLDKAYKIENVIGEKVLEKESSPYYKAIARKDGKFDLYTYKDGKLNDKSITVEYSTVKSLRKDNSVSVQGAWL